MMTQLSIGCSSTPIKMGMPRDAYRRGERIRWLMARRARNGDETANLDVEHGACSLLTADTTPDDDRLRAQRNDRLGPESYLVQQSILMLDCSRSQILTRTTPAVRTTSLTGSVWNGSYGITLFPVLPLKA